MNLGNILAIALPAIAGFGAATGAGKAAEGAASASKAESFISSGAQAFLAAQGMAGQDKRPFQAAAPTPARARSVKELTRGTAVGSVSAATPVNPIEFQMPLYRSVLENLQRTARNSQVREMLDKYEVVRPTKAVGQSGSVRMTEVNI